MTRILLILVVIIALAAVLWSSWRVDRRLFLAVTLLSATALLLFLGGFFHSGDKAFVALPADRVTLELRHWRVTESGVRMEGVIHNGNDQALASVSGRALLRNCPSPESCTDKDSFPLELRQHVPPGRSYPFDTMIRVTHPLPDHPHWELRPERAEGYGEKPRLLD